MGVYMFAAGVPDARIDEAKKAVLLQIVADLPDDFFDPDEWPSPEGGRSTAAECRADLVDAVEFLTIARQSREVTEFTLTVGGHNLLVTGGMSNGDSPTDAYDLFNYIWHCQKLYKQTRRVGDRGPCGGGRAVVPCYLRERLTRKETKMPTPYIEFCEAVKNLTPDEEAWWKRGSTRWTRPGAKKTGTHG